MFPNINHMNRGVFFLSIVVVFLVIGIVFGIAASIILAVSIANQYNDEVIIAALFAPPGVSAVLGIIVGTIAASFYKTSEEEARMAAAKPPIKA